VFTSNFYAYAWSSSRIEEFVLSSAAWAIDCERGWNNFFGEELGWQFQAWFDSLGMGTGACVCQTIVGLD